MNQKNSEIQLLNPSEIEFDKYFKDNYKFILMLSVRTEHDLVNNINNKRLDLTFISHSTDFRNCYLNLISN